MVKSLEEIRAKKAQYQRELRRLRKEAGKCVRCGAEPLPGLTVCKICRMNMNQARSGYVEHTVYWHEKERKAGRL